MRKLINQLLPRDKLLKTTAVIATLIVVYLSLKSPESESESWSIFFIRGDLFLHFVCYFGLSILYYLALLNYERVVIKALILSVFMGSILEILQLIPIFNRFFDVQDLIANFSGTIAGIFLIRFLFSHSFED